MLRVPEFIFVYFGLLTYFPKTGPERLAGTSAKAPNC
jgi:hypothetical protein